MLLLGIGIPCFTILSLLLINTINNKLCCIRTVKHGMKSGFYFTISDKPVMYSSGASVWTHQQFRHPQQVMTFPYLGITFCFRLCTQLSASSSCVSQQDFLGELRRQMHNANPSFTTWWLTWMPCLIKFLEERGLADCFKNTSILKLLLVFVKLITNTCNVTEFQIIHHASVCVNWDVAHSGFLFKDLFCILSNSSFLYL